MTVMALQRVRCLAGWCVCQTTWHPGVFHAAPTCVYMRVCVFVFLTWGDVGELQKGFVPSSSTPSFPPSWGANTSLLVSSKSGSGLCVVPAAAAVCLQHCCCLWNLYTAGRASAARYSWDTGGRHSSRLSAVCTYVFMVCLLGKKHRKLSWTYGIQFWKYWEYWNMKI